MLKWKKEKVTKYFKAKNVSLQTSLLLLVRFYDNCPDLEDMHCLIKHFTVFVIASESGMSYFI